MEGVFSTSKDAPKTGLYAHDDTLLVEQKSAKPCGKPLLDKTKRTAILILIVSKLRFLFGADDRT